MSDSFLLSRMQNLKESNPSAVSDSLLISLQTADNPDAFLGYRMTNVASQEYESGKITADEFKSRMEPYRHYLGDDQINQIFAEVDKYETGKAFSDVAKNFENGVISVPEFKTELEKYRSYLGDDTTNQIISEADRYGREYPATLYNYYIQQYLPQGVDDIQNISPDEIAKQIEYLKNEAIPLAEEKAAASKKAFDIEAGRSYGEARTGKDKEGNSTIGKGRDPELDAAAQTMRADKEALKKLKQELENYEQTTSLKKGIDAYNALSDEDKTLVYQIIYEGLLANNPNEGAREKLGAIIGASSAPTYYEYGENSKKILKEHGVWNDELEKFTDRIINGNIADAWESRIRDFMQDSTLGTVVANALHPLASVFGGFVGAIDSIVQGASNLVSGENYPIDTGTTGQILAATPGIIQDETQSQIQEAVPGWGGEALSFAYGLVPSTVNSLVAAGINHFAPGSGLALLGLESASSAVNEASERGASYGQALAVGTLAGLAEAAFEKMPLDQLANMAKTSPGGIKNLLSRTAKSMGINATEEELTEISNIASDILIMQDKSSYELSIKNYMEKEGLTREEAEKRATIDLAKQVGLAGLGGVAQGGGMSLVGNVIGHLNVSSTGRQIIATPNGIETLLGAAEQGDAAVRKAADAVRQNPSAGNVGNLAAALQEYTKQPVGNVLAYPSQVKAMHNGEFTPPVSTASAASATAGRAANATPPMVNTTPPENMAAEGANTGGTSGAGTSSASTTAAQSEALSGPVQQVAGIISQSNITSSQADRIVKSPELSSAFTELTGKALDGLTNAEKRQTVQASAGFTYTPANGTIETNYQAAPSTVQEGQNGGVSYAGQQAAQAGGYARTAGAAGYGYGAGVNTGESQAVGATFGEANSRNTGGTGTNQEYVVQRGGGVSQSTDPGIDGQWRVGEPYLHQSSNDGKIAESNEQFEEGTVDFIRRNVQDSNRQLIEQPNSLMSYVQADPNSNSNAYRASDTLQRRGYKSVVCDGFIETNADGVTTVHKDALTARDGTVYISNQTQLSPFEIYDHESVHCEQLKNSPAYQAYSYEIDRLLNRTSSAYLEWVDALLNAEEQGAQSVDGENVRPRKSISASVIFRELSAYLHERVVNAPNDAARVYSGMFGDNWQQAVDAVHQFHNAITQEASGSDGSFFDEPDLRSGEDPLSEAILRTMRGEETTEGRRMVQDIASRLGLRVVFDLYGNPAQVGEAYLQGNTIHMNPGATRPLFQIFKHELAHFSEGSRLYNDFANAVMDSQPFREWVQGRGYENPAAYNADIVSRYRAALGNNSFGEYEANLEMLAEYVAEKLYRGDTSGMSALLASLQEKPRRSFVQWVKDFIQRIKEKLRGTGQQDAIQALEQRFSRVLMDAVNAEQQNGRARHSIDPNFERAYDAWDKERTGMQLRLGSTSQPLQSIGVDIRDIYWDTGKIKKIKEKHPQMTDDVIKQVPNILESPILIMESLTVPGRLTLFGEVYDASGVPVLAALELNPTDQNGRSLDIIKVASAYGKDVNPQGLIDKSRILYIGPDKNRTDSWLTVNRLKLPAPSTNYGSINTITSQSRDVNNQSMQDGRKYSIPENPAQIANLTEEDVNTTPPIRRRRGDAVGDKISSFYESVQASSIFDGAFKEQAANDKFLQVYQGVANRDTLKAAKKALDEGGSAYVSKWMNKKPEQMTAEDVAAGVILMDRYQRVGDYEGQIGVAEKLREIGTSAGQTVQMFSILGRFTPEAMTYYAQKSLSDAFDDMVKGRTKKWIDANRERFKLTDEDVDFIRRRTLQAAHLPEGRDKQIKLAEISAHIQNKLPPERGQGLRALQRISMLLNAKTNIRNILGNAIMVPAYWVSDTIGTLADKAVSRATRVRTTGNFRFGKDTAKGFAEGLFNSFDDFVKRVNTRETSADRWDIGQGKSFNEMHTGRMSGPRNALSRSLNALDRVTSFLLDAGDRPFFQMWFVNSLNSQMKFNHADAPTADMIDVATQEALQRTWQDNNGFTKAAKKFKEALNLLPIKVPFTDYGLGDVFIKFVKTPANLTKAIMDFSPVGLVRAIASDGRALYNAVQTGQYTPAIQKKFVDSLGKGIAGTLLYIVFYGMASAGLLSGSGDEDKDANAFNRYIRGVQPYSVKIGDHTFSYEWAQPIGAIMAIMADYVQNKDQSEDSGFFSAIKEGLQAGGTVLFNQSFMQSIQNLFKDDNIVQNVIDGILDEPSAFVPQILSQTASAFDSKARTTYVYGDPIQTTINSVKYKIPGLRNTLPADVDVLGRERENPQGGLFNAYLNPANTYAANSTPVADEIYRLYQETGEKSIFPRKAPNYIQYKGEKHTLTTEQKAEYQVTIGEAAEKYFSDLLDKQAYRSMDDEEKVDIAEALYNYAASLAKAEVVPEYELSQSEELMERLEDAGISAADQMLIKKTADADGNGSLTNKEYEDAVNNSWLQEWAKELMLKVDEASSKRDKETRERAIDRAFEQYGK